MQSKYSGIEVQLSDGSVGFAISPKEDCPHIELQNIKTLVEFSKEKDGALFKIPCKECNDKSENWICLTCQAVCCSRQVNEHMVAHNEVSSHPVVLSFSDLSIWCYECQSYITNLDLEKLVVMLSSLKFKQDDDLQSLNQQMGNLKIDDKFTYQKLIQGLKDKTFKNVCIIAGAGMSVAAGIPDFRTPGTGLYSQLQKYNLPYPEIIFELSFFKTNPEAFYQVAKEFLLSFEAKPTFAHHLLKWLDSRNQLSMCYTQNIDGLELDAGVTPDKVIQAHGHMRSAHCVECGEEATIQEFMEHIKKDKIHRCKSCQKGLIKPDVVFFGEGLPKLFFNSIQQISSADLVFVIGTSLKVMPFAATVQMIPKTTPIVLLNKENVISGRNNVLHLEGDIEVNSKRILNDLK